MKVLVINATSEKIGFLGYDLTNKQPIYKRELTIPEGNINSSIDIKNIFAKYMTVVNELYDYAIYDDIVFHGKEYDDRYNTERMAYIKMSFMLFTTKVIKTANDSIVNELAPFINEDEYLTYISKRHPTLLMDDKLIRDAHKDIIAYEKIYLKKGKTNE